jgi:MFS family permease
MNSSLQLRELLIAYGLAAAGMLAGLLLTRADRRAYWRWPVYSAMAMALGVILWNLLRKHVFPADWPLTHHTFIFYGALGVYVALGFALGLLMGRLTRATRVPGEESGENGEKPLRWR